MSEKLSFEGNIKVWQDDGKVLYDGHNTVTNLLKSAIASMGIGNIFTLSSPMVGGQSLVSTTNIRHWSTQLDYQEPICVYFLNLSPEEKASLNENSKGLPIYKLSADGRKLELDYSKIVGYASCRFDGDLGAAKRGVSEPVSGVNLTDFNCSPLQFKWEAGKMDGEYNTIAVGFDHTSKMYTGLSVYRYIQPYDSLTEDITNINYMIPGVKSEDGTVVWTADDEILVGDNVDNTKARKVIHLSTGEYETLDPGDPRYDLALYPAGSTFQVVQGDYLNNAGFSVRNIKTNQTTGRSWYYCAFKYNGYYYAMQGARPTLFEAYSDPSYSSRVSAQDKSAADLHIPTDLCVMDDRGGYTLRVMQLAPDLFFVGQYVTAAKYKWFSSSSVGLTYENKGFLCTDIGNAAGSVVAVLPDIEVASMFMYQGQPYLIGHYPNAPYHTLNTVSSIKYFGTGGSVAKEKHGLSVARDFGNLLSFKTFDEPQKISAAQGLHLRYSYSFQ